MATDIKDTLNLPQTAFPMRGNLPKKEPQRLQHWQSLDLYHKNLAKRKESGKKSFILHDGPPFTNGNLHLGHALNKTLKDITLRYKNLQGHPTPYIPGWDCHGLPIEHRVAKDFQEQNKAPSTEELRSACAEFSQKFIEIQRSQFQRLGVNANWQNEYKTLQPQYEGTILASFAHFVEQDLVYRSKKPVYWSIPCQTALAEAEIEYKDKKSPSVYVRFAIQNPQDFDLPSNSYVVIWTTTPWTLPANLAITLHEKISYQAVQVEDATYLVAKDLLGAVSAACDWSNPQVVKEYVGQDLAGMITQHPFIDRPSPVFFADYVTTESGTGCVHTAPGHGQDDYLTGIKNGLEVYCPIDDNACYIDDGQIPASLVGLGILEEKGISPANRGVLKLMAETGCLLKKENYLHQYPHCWRSKTPVIFRAMDQWFVSLEKNDTKQKCLDALQNVQFIPNWGKNRIEGFVQGRPDWCISRQRSWGVPIPAFYDSEGQAYIDADVTRAIAQKIAQQGTQIWFTQSASELLSGITLPAHWQVDTLKPGKDTLDVWIDSGCSHRAVLQQNEELSWPADLYLEGSDQHRGWFQSSLWTGIIADQAAPYRSVLTHGFIVKGDGTKLSKSDEENKSLVEWIDAFGADIIRLWICSQDYRGDVPVSEKIVQNVSQAYRSFRNTFRFQIGNLHDFDAATMAIKPEDMNVLDQWALHKNAELISQVQHAYGQYEYHKAYQLITNYVTNTLSATYHDIIKDRMYTFAPNDPLRRSSQSAIAIIFESLISILSPVLPFTTDEAWAYYQNDSEFHSDNPLLFDWPEQAQSYLFPQAAADIDIIQSIKANFSNEQLEKLRQAKTIGQSLDAQLLFQGDADHRDIATLLKHQEYLAEFFIVSAVHISHDQPTFSVEAKHADGVRCPRSWRWVPQLVETTNWGAVSPRCANALETLQSMKLV